jgi:anthranilate synthase/aminodeoxychorismate synthase-like glutamine amidotransferase
MVLLIDNYDSFTYMLRDYVLQCGEECMVIRNDEKTIAEIGEIDFYSIIISPGPRAPAEAGISMDVIRTFQDSKPILGICLGHQAIGEIYGAKLVSAAKPMHGKTSMITHSGHPIFNNIPEQIEVMRYHSLILENVAATELTVIAETMDGEVMAIAHPTKKIVGLQFHPESILSPYGLQMIKNWFEMISSSEQFFS